MKSDIKNNKKESSNSLLESEDEKTGFPQSTPHIIT